MAQLAYNLNQDAYALGMLVDCAFKHTESKICDASANGPIVVGQGVVKVPGSDYTVKLPDGTDNTLYGIAHRTQILEAGLPGTDAEPQYEDKDVVNVLRRGAIVVYCETAFDPDSDTLYLRHTANGALVPGNFRNDADTGNAVAVTGNFQVKNTLAAAGNLIIELNKPA